MKDKNSFFPGLVILFIFVLPFIKVLFPDKYDKQIKNLQIPQQSLIAEPLSVYVVENKRTVPRIILRDSLKKNAKKKTMVLYSLPDAQEFIASAPGTDYKHHFVNAYLEGYKPFDTNNLWLPLYTLSKRKKYMLDKNNYKGKRDIWQSSKEAYRNTRGDCEDHAIALADWLISLGEDARVVIGKYNGGGHAWVVLIKDNKEFILEATQKSRTRSTKFPLSSVKPNYNPIYMFNRNTFWKNTGSINTTSYRNNKWIKKSLYKST